MKKLNIIAIVLMVAVLGINAQKSDWDVPVDKAERLRPTKFSDENVKVGEALYNANCVSCHGNPSKKNFIPLVPEPGDAADSKFSVNLDGELLYKLQEGRGAMPSFKATLSTTDLWNVIAYIRTFHKDYSQKIAVEVVRSGLSGGKVAVKLSHNKEKNTIEALVTEVKPDEIKPITGALVKLYALRYFGQTLIDEEKSTNSDGIVSFHAPNDLPGDSLGNVELVLKLSDEDAFGEISESATLKVGEVTITESLIAKRAMWGTVQKAPYWILLTYGLGVLVAWGIIFFIFFQMYKIYMAGKEDEENGVVREDI